MPHITFKTIVSICIAMGSFVTLPAQARPELIAKGDVVYDSATNLSWARCSVGTKWSAEKNYCIGVKSTLSGHEVERKTDLGNGWRIPTVNELQTLLRKPASAGGLYIDTMFSDVVDIPEEHYWTSTSDGWSRIQTISFVKGSAESKPIQMRLPLRLVKTGQ
jgi:hypothetical protein